MSISKSKGERLPKGLFRVPLLEVLVSEGGKGETKRIRALMEKKMAPLLSAADYETVSTGDPRWWNAVCWERYALVKEGLLQRDSPRGIWAITDKGKLQVMKTENTTR